MQVISVGSGAFLTTTDKSATVDGATNILRQATPPTSAQVLRFLKGVMAAPRPMNSSMEGSARAPGLCVMIFNLIFRDTLDHGMLAADGITMSGLARNFVFTVHAGL